MGPRNRNSQERSASSASQYNRAEFNREFPDDAACLAWLWRNLYSADGQTADCPRCQQPRKFHRIKTRPSYSCDVCGLHIHPTANTIFHKSSTSLKMWFEAIFLMSATRCGISAAQLEREIGVNYKTAWRMFREIRKLLAEEGDPFSGEVEADETYVGGKRRLPEGAHGGGRPGRNSHKTAVFGMVERGGRVYASVVPDVRQRTILPHIEKRVLPSSTVYTDEFKSYDKLTTRGYADRRVQHAEEIYVMGTAHINTMEGFWSLLKRGIGGVYHSVSRKYLQTYLDEYSFRYNHRNDPEAMFRSLLVNVKAERASRLASATPS